MQQRVREQRLEGVKSKQSTIRRSRVTNQRDTAVLIFDVGLRGIRSEERQCTSSTFQLFVGIQPYRPVQNINEGKKKDTLTNVHDALVYSNEYIRFFPHNRRRLIRSNTTESNVHIEADFISEKEVVLFHSRLALLELCVPLFLLQNNCSVLIAEIPRSLFRLEKDITLAAPVAWIVAARGRDNPTTSQRVISERISSNACNRHIHPISVLLVCSSSLC